MNIDEIIHALEATDFHQDCDYCEFSELCRGEDCVILQAADALTELQAENKALRNELCYKCGQYREAHNGACNGCKWRKEQNDG